MSPFINNKINKQLSQICHQLYGSDFVGGFSRRKHGPAVYINDVPLSVIESLIYIPIAEVVGQRLERGI